MTMKNFKPCLGLLVVVALVACGGGGGGGTTTTGTATVQGPVTPPVVSTLSNIVTSVPTPSYAVGSEELAAMTLLNAERSFCGFGVLAQSTKLDTAAKAHADWQLLNNFSGHQETPGTSGFTGATAEARVVAAAYGVSGSFAVNDDIVSVFGRSIKTGYGREGIRDLLNAPYHAKSLLTGNREIGVSVRSSADVGSTFGPRLILQLDMARKTADGPQSIDGSGVATYPCEGSTEIVRSLTGESPNPVPGRDLSANPLGSSIQVMLRDGNTLTITSAMMIKVATGAAVTLRPPVTSANDPYAPCESGCFKSHQGYIAADAPLETSTKYQVTITGTNNGTAFSRTFSFTTGS